MQNRYWLTASLITFITLLNPRALADEKTTVFLRPNKLMYIPIPKDGTYSPTQKSDCKLLYSGTPRGVIKEWGAAGPLTLQKKSEVITQGDKKIFSLFFGSCTGYWGEKNITMSCLNLEIKCEYPISTEIPTEECLISQNFKNEFVVNEMQGVKHLQPSTCPQELKEESRLPQESFQ